MSPLSVVNKLLTYSLMYFCFHMFAQNWLLCIYLPEWRIYNDHVRHKYIQNSDDITRKENTTYSSIKSNCYIIMQWWLLKFLLQLKTGLFSRYLWKCGEVLQYIYIYAKTFQNMSFQLNNKVECFLVTTRNLFEVHLYNF